MAVNDYCAWTDVEVVLVGPTWGTAYDAAGSLLCTRASRKIDTFVGVEPGFFYVSDASTRWFPGTGSPYLWIGRLAAAPGTVALATGGTVDNAGGTGGSYATLTQDDYQLWQANALLVGEPYQRLDIIGNTYTVWTAGEKTVKITGLFGWGTATPDEVKQATIIEVAKIMNRGLQGYQDTGAVVDLAQLTYTQPLDPETVAVLQPIIEKVRPKKGSQ